LPPPVFPHPPSANASAAAESNAIETPLRMLVPLSFKGRTNHQSPFRATEAERSELELFAIKSC
jgi:hypothetical protein